MLLTQPALLPTAKLQRAYQAVNDKQYARVADSSLFLGSYHLPPQSCKHLMQTNSSWLNWKTIEETTEKSRRRITVTQLRCLQVKNKQTKKTRKKNILQEQGAEIGTKWRTAVQTNNHTEVFQLEYLLTSSLCCLIIKIFCWLHLGLHLKSHQYRRCICILFQPSLQQLEIEQSKNRSWKLFVQAGLYFQRGTKISVILLLQDTGRKSPYEHKTFST